MWEYIQEQRYFYVFRSAGLCVIVWKRMHSCSDEIFAEHCEAFESTVIEHGPFPAAINYASVFTASAQQREMVAQRAVRMGTSSLRRLVLVTESPWVAGAISAIRWSGDITTEVAMFSPPKVEECLDWCAEEANFDRKTVVQAIRKGIQLVEA